MKDDSPVSPGSRDVGGLGHAMLRAAAGEQPEAAD